MSFHLPNEILYQVNCVRTFLIKKKIFLYLRGKDLCSCSCVCLEWNLLIQDSKQLSQRRKSLDAYKKITTRYLIASCFPQKDNRYIHIGVDCLPNRILVSDWNSHNIKVLDNRGHNVFTFGSKGTELGQFCSPLGICSVNCEYIWIADHGNYRIQLFNLKYQPIKSISTGKYRPTSICNSNGGVVVLTDGPEILHFDYTGHLIDMFYYTDYGDFGNSMCYNNRNEILVVHWSNSKIIVIDKDGKYVREFGSKGNGPSQLDFPCGICVDWENNIFVADQLNDRISVFTPEGIPIQQISFFRPSNLCFMKRKMIVLSENGTIGVFSN